MFAAPLHPLFVHFPIALLTVGTLVYLYIRLKPAQDQAWHRISLFLIATGWLTGLLALTTGAINFSSVPDSHPAHPTGVAHATLAFVTEVFYLIGLRLALKPRDQRFAWLFLTLGLLALIATGYFGGELVYHWKLGIAG